MLKRYDPLLCDIDLPLRGEFFPAGFPLHLETNSPLVMEAARESWSAFAPAFDVAPLRFRVVVGGPGNAAGMPTFRKQAALLSFVSDGHNFATADTISLSAGFFLSVATVADSDKLRWLFLDAMAYMLLTQRYVVSVHAACVARDGVGTLLGGKSGAGKSTLSIACARAGFTFVADDCTWVRTGVDDLTGIGRSHQARLRHDAARHFPELAGLEPRRLPNGKLSIEAPMSIFPQVQTAPSAAIGRLVFIDRASEGAARIEPVGSAEAFRLLMADLPSYGPEVNAAHERTVARLAELPAFRLIYRELDEAVNFLV
jgi:hypothetical protein